jgi:hypothetical protein
MDIKRLSEPFDPSKVHWRVGAMTKDKSKCIALAYIDARDVMERLDDVCGPENWQCKYEHASNHGYVCSIGIRIDGEWIWKANGAGETQVEAQKGAMSDSFKRAAVLWGIGRYLYDVPNTWVAIDQYKKIVESELPRLMRTLPNAPKQATVQTASQPTPFDDEPAQQQADEMLSELSDIKETISNISTAENLNGLWKTARVKRLYGSLPAELQQELVEAFGERKRFLTAREAA